MLGLWVIPRETPGVACVSSHNPVSFGHEYPHINARMFCKKVATLQNFRVLAQFEADTAYDKSQFARVHGTRYKEAIK
jgi:hypothetical protein